MRRLVVLLVLIALPALAGAAESRAAYFNVRYDLDATTATGCIAAGERGGVWDSPIAGADRVDNGGSSTAVTAVTALDYPFAGMAVRDTMWIKVGETWYPRTILTYTDADNVVVDEAIDLSGDATGYAFQWRKHVCGTTAADGWISLDNMTDVTIILNFGQVVDDTNGVILRVEGSPDTPDGYNHVHQLWPTDKTVSGAATTQTFDGTGITDNLRIQVPIPIQRVRILVEFHTADDGNDLTTNSENLTFMVFGQYQGR
jgi:hypothetical protein